MSDEEENEVTEEDEPTQDADESPEAVDEPQEAIDESREAADSEDDDPRRRTLVDSIMRGSIMVLLGVVVTAPLWYRDQMTENFRPTTFRADRETDPAGEEGGAATLEGRITREVVAIIRTAGNDEMVSEDEVIATVGGMLEEADIGDEESRRENIGQLVADITAQAAEMDGARGLNDLQAQAVQGTARMMARSLITNLGGELDDGDAEEVEGDWTPAAWPVISGFEYEEGMELPEQVAALDGQDVMGWGYLINLDQDQYLLVQSLWSCCFGTPPDLHEAIVIRADSAEADQFEGRGVRIYGRFEASEIEEDGYVTSLYRIDARHVRAM
ncbi:MAG: hypothetical protein ACI9KE_000198 [Polyangiales bacterium]|jgi:hypothetical protein